MRLLLNNLNAFNRIIKRNISYKEYENKIKKCYEILKIDEKSDQESVREAYIKLVKIYHPDSGSPEANVDKFQEIEAAFRIINKKNAQDRWNVDEDRRIKEFDIKHTAPQHRQYLSYEGSGSGTPAQREKQWAKTRASRAAQNVMEHRVSKAIASENALLDKTTKHKHDIKTKYGYDRLVEDLIQEAMSKGEFDNLKGNGKPLPSSQNLNPYVDFVTHKINQVLIDNGFTPEWITLQKDIKCDIDSVRHRLKTERKNLGPLPLDSMEEQQWLEFVDKFAEFVKILNSKINHYNLVVPILNKQIVLFSLEKEAEKILKDGEYRKLNSKVNLKIKNKSHDSENDIFTYILSKFK